MIRYYPSPEASLSMRDLIPAVRSAFIDHGNGACRMPPKTYLPLPGGDLRTMPAYLPSLGCAGVKVVNVHPENRQAGLPTVMAMTLLLDPPTGLPLALLNATGLTDLRTGAAAGIATGALSGRKKGTVGIIGAGRQAVSGLSAIAEVIAVESVSVWSRTEKTAETFVRMFPDLDIRISTLEHAAGAEILLTTTPSRAPLIEDGWICEGTHINAIGADAPGKEELDPALLLRSQVFVDDREQAVHSGEINSPSYPGDLPRR